MGNYKNILIEENRKVGVCMTIKEANNKLEQIDNKIEYWLKEKESWRLYRKRTAQIKQVQRGWTINCLLQRAMLRKLYVGTNITKGILLKGTV